MQIIIIIIIIIIIKALATYCVETGECIKYNEIQHPLMFCCHGTASSAISMGLFSLASLYTVLTIGRISFATHKGAN
jgi:hypothetical protein